MARRGAFASASVSNKLFSVTGSKELDDALEQFELKVRRKILKQTIRRASRELLADAKANAPVDSGDLRNSIKLRVKKVNKRNKSEVGMMVLTGDQLFKGDQFYAAFIEFGAPGHKPYGKGDKYTGIGNNLLEPKPYLRPAMDKNEPLVVARFKAEMPAIIKSTADKLAAKSKSKAKAAGGAV